MCVCVHCALSKPNVPIVTLCTSFQQMSYWYINRKLKHSQFTWELQFQPFSLTVLLNVGVFLYILFLRSVFLPFSLFLFIVFRKLFLCTATELHLKCMFFELSHNSQFSSLTIKSKAIKSILWILSSQQQQQCTHRACIWLIYLEIQSNSL